MRFRWLWSKTERIECPDGQIRFVYRDVDDILPLHVKSKKSHSEAALDVAKQAKAKLSSQHQEKVERVLFQIDSANASTQTAYRSAYAVYSTAPCEKHEYFAAAVERVTRHQEKMQRTHLALDMLLRATSAKTITATTQEQISGQLSHILHELGEPAQLLAEKMSEVADNNTEWRK